MAIDWNKEITFSSVKDLFKRGKGEGGGSSGYPTKKTMNLYQVAEHSANLFSVAVTGVLLAIGIGLFVKFGVLDQLSALSQKQGELARQQAAVEQARKGADGYDEIKEAYDGFLMRYGDGNTDAITVLQMVEDKVMKSTEVTSIVLSDNTLTLTLYNVPLDTVGKLAKDLENQEIVTSVNMSNATTQDTEGQNTVSTLVVNLVGGNSEEE